MSDLPAAKRKPRGWWPGLIWAVPLAVLGIVGWLGIRAITNTGPSVTVRFARAAGVKAGDTKVQYQGMEVGEVEEVEVASDLSHVTLTLQLDKTMRGHLGAGTRFWVAGQQFSLGHPAALKALISGPFIGVDPGPGAQTDHFTGLDQAPVLEDHPHGTRIVLTAGKLGSVQRGTPIYYHDLQVGEVTADRLDEATKQMVIDAFVDAPYDQLVHANTRFWNAGAVQLSTAGGGPRLAFQSLPALFEGAIGFDSFGDPGAPAQDGARFTLYGGEDAARGAPLPGSVDYLVVFHGPAAGLAAGDAVTLMDARIGSVKDVTLGYDPRDGALAVRATLALEPSRIRLDDGARWAADRRPQLDAMLRRLIGEGLRAELGASVPLVGAKQVTLAMVPAAPPATLGAGDPPEIPAGPGRDIGAVIASASGVLAKVDAIPFQQIGEDVRRTTDRVAALADSAQTAATLRRVEATIDNVRRMTSEAKAQVGPILAEMHRAADDADAAVASARRMLQPGGGGPQDAGLPSALYELTRTARSVRELADYLDRHPEALIEGKSASR